MKRHHLGVRLVEILIDPKQDIWEEKIFLMVNKGEVFRFKNDWYNNCSNNQIGYRALSNAFFDDEGSPAVDCCQEFKNLNPK